jgi:hypothetical protein
MAVSQRQLCAKESVREGKYTAACIFTSPIKPRALRLF